MSPLPFVRTLLATIFLGVASTAAAVTHRYVAVGGSFTYAQSTNPATPCDLSTANSNAAPGDVFHLGPGNHATSVNPSASGDSINRVWYVADSLRVPSQTQVTGINLLSGTDFVTVKGLRVNGTTKLVDASTSNSAYRDSIIGCTLTDWTAMLGTIRCVLLNDSLVVGTAGGNDFNLRLGGQALGSSGASPNRCTIQGCVIEMGGGSGLNSSTRALTFEDAIACTSRANQIRFTLSSGATGEPANWFMYNCDSTYSNGDVVTMDINAIGGTYALNLRDGSSDNKFYNLAITDIGSLGSKVLLATNGSVGDTLASSEKRNVLRNSTIRIRGDFGYEASADGDSLVSNVIASKDSLPLNFRGQSSDGPVRKNLVIRHNTFASWTQSASCVGVSGGHPRWATFSMHGNIVWCKAWGIAGTSCDSTTTASESPLVFAYGPAGNAEMDSSLYYMVGGDASQVMRLENGNCSGVGTGRHVCVSYSNECASRFANPVFADTSWTGFNPTPSSGSQAIGTGWPDCYAGAVYADVVSPGRTTTLSAGFGTTTGVVAWIAVGDDSTCGVASEYDLRMSTSPINSGNFASATAIATGEPQPPGTSECVELSELTCNTTYYFALKTRDKSNAWSILSNLPSGTTRACNTNFVVGCGSEKSGNQATDAEGVPIPALELAVRPVPVRTVAHMRVELAAGHLRDALDVVVLDLAGREVADIFRGIPETSIVDLVWDLRTEGSRRAAPGVYLIRARWAGKSQVTPFVVVE